MPVVGTYEMLYSSIQDGILVLTHDQLKVPCTYNRHNARWSLLDFGRLLMTMHVFKEGHETAGCCGQQYHTTVVQRCHNHLETLLGTAFAEGRNPQNEAWALFQ